MGERIIASAAAMQDFAAEIADTLQGGELLLLTGELGAGKTTFVQGLAQALGVTVAVTSPTFVIASAYEANHSRIKELLHLDLYRLPTGGATATDPAVLSVLSEVAQAERVTVIEWADRLPSPPRGQKIHFQHGQDSGQRVVSVTT